MPLERSQCTQKVQLVADYGAAVTAYYAAVCQLEEGMITGSIQIYEDRYKAAESARGMCEAARTALTKHVAEHRC